MSLVHWWALISVAAVWAAVSWPIDPMAATSAAIGLLSLAVALPAGSGRHAVVSVGVLAIVAAHAAAARDHVLAPPLGVWFAAETSGAGGGAPPAPVRLRGVLVEDAALTASGVVRLRIDVSAVEADAYSWLSTRGLVQLFVQGTLAPRAREEWTRGRPVVATAMLRWPPVLNNPGGVDPLRQRLMRRYVLTGSIKSAALVAVEPAAWWYEVPSAVRRHVRHTTDILFGADRPVSAAIVRAILIGDRDGLDRGLTERLIDAGTYHVVAISGGNVALVTLLTVLTLRRLLRSPRLVPLAALLAVAGYGWTVGAEPSVTRAVTAAMVWLAAEAIGLRVPPLRILSLVVLLVVARDPLIVVMPGAWLSFGATLGILACAARLAAWIAGLGTPARPTRTASIVRMLAGLGAATLAAELVLLPVGAWTFSRISVAGVLLNFLAIPAMATVQIAGGLAVVLAALLPTPAEWATAAAHGATCVLVESARLVEWLPQLAWRVPPPHPLVVLMYYAALTLLLARVAGRGVQRGALVVAASMLLVIVTGPAVLLARPPAGTLRVTFLDVGQGDAIVVQLPAGQVLVVDAGPAGESFDSGERVVTPALWALGARRVDWVAFTHADLDHIGGLGSVAQGFDAREIWEGVPVPRDGNRMAMRDLATSRRLVWRELRQGDRWESGGAVVSVLHPSAPDWERQQVRNDDSLVIRIRYGPLDILLTGDVGRDVEAALPVGDEEQGDIRLLKMAHHGSRTSSGPDLIATYRPWAAVVSVGRNNTFGHPAPDVLERFEDAGVTVLRTDRDGAVSVETDGRIVSVRTWSGRFWRATTRRPA